MNFRSSMSILTLSKKFLSVLLSVILIFSFAPAVAFGDTQDSEQNQAKETQLENQNTTNSSSQITADELSTATEQNENQANAENTPDKQESNADEIAQKEKNNQQTAFSNQGNQTAQPRTLDDDSAFEFIYVDQKEIELGKTQSIVVSFMNAGNAESSELFYSNENGDVLNVKPTQVADGAALYEITFTDASQLGKYKLEKVSWGGNESGEALISNCTEEGYSFAVIDAIESDEEGVSVYAIDESGNITEKENLSDAIEESDVNATNQNNEIAPLSLNANSKSNTKAGGMVIALDPGHGGDDPGATNGSLIEKNLNLKIATYCKAALDQYSGVTTFMTRSTDEAVELTDRVQRAVNAGADLFVSFHINSFQGATGFEVWIQNDSSWRYYLHEESAELGNAILDKLEKFGIKNRGNKEGDYSDGLKYPDGSEADSLSVLRESRNNNIPAVLIEHGFINGSAADQALLSNESSLKAMGEADAEAIAETYDLSQVKPKPWMADSSNKSITLQWDAIDGAENMQ